MNLEPARDYLNSKDIRGRAITSSFDLQAKDLTRDAAVQSRTLTTLEYRSLEVLLVTCFRL